MKKNYLILSSLMVLALAFGAVSPAFAGDGDQPEHRSGALKEYLVEAFASVAGLDLSEVQSRRDAGESLKDIAESLDIIFSMSDVISSAAAQALADGVISQEQADRITSRDYKSGTGPFSELGLSTEEIRGMRDSGMTMQEIFAQQGMEFNHTRKGSGEHDGSKLMESCGITREELRERVKNGETLPDICPGVKNHEGAQRPSRDS